MLDLRGDTAREKVGLELTDIADDDWMARQSVGQAVHFLNFGGVLAPSATGVGLVLTAFESRLRPGQLTVQSSEPLTADLFVQLSA